MKPESSRAHLEILIVEDSATQAQQLQYMLEEHDFHIVATRNGRELMTNLTLTMNRTRQASITNQILEVVSGAEALK